MRPDEPVRPDHVASKDVHVHASEDVHAETTLPSIVTPEPASRAPVPAPHDQRLSPRYVRFQRTVGVIVAASMAALLAIGLLIAWYTGGLPRSGDLMLGPGWLVASTLLAWHAWAWPPLEYRHTSYRLDHTGIEVKTGVIWRKVTNVPRSRVQHIDVAQGPVERSYQLGRLVIYTAGTEHSKIELPGLDYTTAFEMRAHLLPKGQDDAV